MQHTYKHATLLIALLGMILVNAGPFAAAQETELGCRTFVTGVGETGSCANDPNVLALHAVAQENNSPYTFIVLDDQGCIVDAAACKGETSQPARMSLETRQTNLARYDFSDGTTVLVASGPSCSIYVGTCTGNADCTIYVGTCSGFGDCSIYVGGCGGNGDCDIFVGFCHGDCDIFVGICYGDCDVFVGICFDGGQCTHFVGLCYDDGTCTVFAGTCGSPPYNQVMYHGFHLQPENDGNGGTQFANHRDTNAFTRVTFQAV